MDPEVEKVLDQITLDDVTEQAIAASRAGGAVISDADAHAAQARAKELIEDARKDPANNPLSGIEDMRALSLSIGLSVPRTLFAAVARASTAKSTRVKVWLRQIAAISPITEVGCIKLDFVHRVTKEPTVARLVLEPCGADHDLGAQLEPLYAAIDPARKEEVLKQLSMLVYLGRSAYGQMLNEHPALIKAMAKKIPGGFDPLVLGVDPSNTTLYVGIPETQRVGIFVHITKAVDNDV